MRDPASAWAALDAELSAWRQAGRTATLWWRDDDAIAAGSALAQLLPLAEKFSIPLTLAVVPRQTERSLPQAIGAHVAVTPIMHGYAHQNYAPETEKPAEFGAHRPLDAMLAELRAGIRHMTENFGGQLFPVFVPPWNRMSDALIPLLTQLGFRGVSTFRPARNRRPAPGLVQTNCHIDAINWRDGRSQRGEEAVLGELTDLLRIRRLYPDIAPGEKLSGKAVPAGFDAAEPTGILTHHLVQLPESWAFLTQLFGAIQPHCGPGGGARWLSCAEAFTL